MKYEYVVENVTFKLTNIRLDANESPCLPNLYVYSPTYTPTIQRQNETYQNVYNTAFEGMFYRKRKLNKIYLS